MNVGATELKPWSDGVVNTDEVTPGLLRVTGLFVEVTSPAVNELIPGGS